MNPLFTVFPTSELCGRLVLVLLHSLWQASLSAALLWLALRCLGAGRATVRYRLSVTALALVVAIAVLTWSFLGRTPARRVDAASKVEGTATATSANQTSTDSRTIGISVSGADETATVPSETPPVARPIDGEAGGRATQWSKALAAVWLTGVFFMLLRVLVCVRAGRQMVRGARPLDVPLIQVLLDELRQRLGLLRAVQVKVCDAVSVPAVLGVVWPVLLVPPALVTGMPIDALRVILTHELAHVRRYDYLVNLGQLLVEAVLFFNPAVWWISRRIRIERESCCDHLATLVSGEPLAVARTLLVCAQAALAGGANAPWPIAAQAYDGSGSPGTLWERVRRIVVPHEIPRVRLPWYTLVGLLVGGCVALAGLERGGDLVAQVAIELLSPQQRVDKLEQVEKEYGQTGKPPAAPTPKFRIAGTVRMTDGSPVPKEVSAWATLLTWSPAGSSVNVDHLPLDAAGRFDKELTADAVYLSIRGPNLATTYAGPYSASDGNARDLHLAADQGFSGRIRFVNQAGDGISGVVLERIQYPLRGVGRSPSSGYAHPQQDARLESNADGFATLEGCSRWPCIIDVRGNGYQFEQQEHELQPETPLVWKLTAARPTTGIVLDDATGRPIAGAEFLLADREGYVDSAQDPRAAYATVIRLATSDGDGRFELGSLRDDSRYAIYVRAPGHAVKLLRDLHAGQRGLKVRLGPPLYIKGQIRGKLDRLQTDRETKTPFFYGRNPIELLSGSYDYYFIVPVRVADGVGHFEIAELFPGTAKLELPDRVVSLNLTEPIDDYAIDLDQPQKPAATFENLPQRRVVLRFNLPTDAPPPRGQLRVGVQLPLLPDRPFEDRYLDINGPELHFEAPVGGRLFYDGDKVVGYWIENQTGIDVPADDAPLEIAIRAVPAGGIYGRVYDWSGKPAANCHIHLLTVEKAPHQPFESMDTVNVQNADGRFALGQVPLGGRYRLLAVADDSQARALSPIMLIDEQHPLAEIELRFVAGVTLAGQVLGPDGAPVAGAELQFEYTSPHRQGFSGGLRTITGADGRFRFEHVDPQLPGRYSLAVVPGQTLCGASLPIDDPTSPLTITVAGGLTVKGILLDATTSQPLADKRVAAVPSSTDFARVRYHGSIHTRTDSAGHFRFDNLEAVHYQLMVPGEGKLRVVGAERSSPDDNAVLEAGQEGWAMVKVERASLRRGIDAEGRQNIFIDQQGDYYLGDAASPNARASSLDALIDEVRRNARAAGGLSLKVTVSAHESVKYSQLRGLLDRLERTPNVGGISIKLNR